MGDGGSGEGGEGEGVVKGVTLLKCCIEYLTMYTPVIIVEEV